MSHARPVYLVGMMGVGKSTIGKLLARRLGRRFLDTDQEIERSESRSIAEIFAADGEARFRALEAEWIDRLARGAADVGQGEREGEALVVALGGGAIAQPGAADRLLSSGEVVFLAAEPERLLDRIGPRSDRPLLAGLDRDGQLARLEALLSERMPHYRRANHRVDASGSAEEVVERIVERILDRLGAD